MTFRIPIVDLGRSLEVMGGFPFDSSTNRQYPGPTLFVRGSKSGYVPDSLLPLIAKFFPNFDLVELECGHWVISEQPKAFRQGKVFVWDKSFANV